MRQLIIRLRAVIEFGPRAAALWSCLQVRQQLCIAIAACVFLPGWLPGKEAANAAEYLTGERGAHHRQWLKVTTKADGISNLAVQTASTDPNDINFSIEVANDYVSTQYPNLQLNIAGGVPSYFTMLVDSTNFNAASWTGFTSANLTANLGANPAQGWHDVWVGLKGRLTNGEPAWMWCRLKYDTVPPVISVTNPVTSVVDVPMIQLRGFSSEELDHISCDVSNALGLATNLQTVITDREYDSARDELTTNCFESLDIELTNGVNVITVRATDLAGNTTGTNFSFTVDYSSKTNPPLVQLTWPTNSTLICGNQFTLRGTLSDPTATVKATIANASGTTNAVGGLVERDGKFWVENLPLSAGTNTVVVTVADAIGNTTVTNISVAQSTLVMTVTPLADLSQLWQPTVNLTGTISETTYGVWVNGVKGTNHGNGTWSANNVPVNRGGTASFIVTAYSPDETQPDGSHGN